MAEPGSEEPPPRRKQFTSQWLDHFNAADLKVFARCWLAAWASMLLIFIQPSLEHIGSAAFFGTIVLFIVPPTGTVLIYLLAAMTLLLGMCLAWVWGLLTMKAAFAARPASTTNALLEELQKNAIAAANRTGETPQWEAQILIHQGALFDTRVTVIFYVMGCVFIYALCRLRSANPKFTLTQIFGIVVTDIFMEFGPSLPGYVGDIPSVMVKPAAIGIGLGAASCVLICPQSTSYLALNMMTKLVRLSKQALEVTRKRLAEEEVTVVEARALRMQMIGTIKAAQPHVAFLPLDFSRGVWNADDVQALQEDIRKLLFSSLYLIDFHIGRLKAAEILKQRVESQEGEENGLTAKEGTYHVGQRHRQQSTKLLLALQRPDQTDIQHETQQAMRETTEDILRLSSEAVELAADAMHMANSCRWIGTPKPAQFDQLIAQMQEMRDKVRVAREESIRMTAERVLEAHSELFDEKGMLKVKGNDHPILPSMVVAMVLEERIVSAASAIERLLHHLQKLCEKQKTPRIWLPSRLQYAIAWVGHGRTAVPGQATNGEVEGTMYQDPDDLFDQTEEVRRRLEITRSIRGSAARRNKLSKALSAIYQWFTDPAGMYALRMVIVTIALTIPATLSSMHRQCSSYMSEFTFSFVTRTLGTIIGGAVGMVAWYIGAGNGPGNPYGMAASTAVVLLFILWARLFAPPTFLMAIIMGAATFALVIGFSWDEGYLRQYGLPGVGYMAFWKRVVTVLIGFLAAFIVQIFPRPPSATRHACKTLANSVRSLSDHYALLVSHWGRQDDNTRALRAVSGTITLEVAEVLASLDSTIGMLPLELSSSPFDQKTLKQAQEQCQYMNQALGGLLELVSDLPINLQDRLSKVIGIKDDRGIGDIMAILGILEQALRTGSPLPERLPAPLVARAVETYLSIDEKGMTAGSIMVANYHQRRYCVAVTLYLKFLTAVDDLLLTLKSALGERHIVYEWGDA
ncbi:hypothetical protein NLU13_7161 [Sarocladium strictum]|uniref:ER transporter 6TM N-terminal domain-containing protein n=1 Tax=Sarocladium strictum TaxID=5046 RepID=A0AA39GCA4_SARSR|nr:hypothetical protein NLU13_7161 [Sarocladium strictum]